MRVILLVGLMAAAAASVNADQDPLDAARDLYASAAYEEALSTLSRLSEGGESAPASARQVEEYRAFCLFALGRRAEAESVAESLIRREPLAALEAADASPRLEAMFIGVRKRILPGLIRDQYRALRGLLDQKQYAAAEPRLAEAQRMLTEAERLGAWDAGLADLSVLVDGFLTLSRAHVATGTPAPVATAAIAPPPRSAVAGPSEHTTAVSIEAPGGTRTYSVEDENVTPPVPIQQRSPILPIELLTILRTQRGPTILSLTIDETGRVLKTDVRVSVNTRYDNLLVNAAGNWRYTPALRNGVPVRYQKTVVVTIK